MPQRRYAVPFLMCRSNHRFTDGYDYKLLCVINLIAIKKCKSILLNNNIKTLQGIPARFLYSINQINRLF